jgi:hypothetical protein
MVGSWAVCLCSPLILDASESTDTKYLIDVFCYNLIWYYIMSFSTVWNNWQQQRKAVNKINLELSKVLRVEAFFSLKPWTMLMETKKSALVEKIGFKFTLCALFWIYQSRKLVSLGFLNEMWPIHVNRCICKNLNIT